MKISLLILMVTSVSSYASTCPQLDGTYFCKRGPVDSFEIVSHSENNITSYKINDDFITADGKTVINTHTDVEDLKLHTESKHECVNNKLISKMDVIVDNDTTDYKKGDVLISSLEELSNSPKGTLVFHQLYKARGGIFEDYTFCEKSPY